METKRLFKISLIVALIGIVMIIVLSENVEPGTKKISEINEGMLEEWVNIIGVVKDDRRVENLIILTIYDGSSIRAILSKNIEGSLEGKEVEITGKVIEYRGEIEIQISRLEVK